MTEIREEWAAKARDNLDTCSALATGIDEQLLPTTEVYTHDATLPFSQLQKSDAIGATVSTAGEGAGSCVAVPEDVDAVVMNPPWGKRIGNLSREHGDEGAIVRSLLSQFVRVPVSANTLMHVLCSRCSRSCRPFLTASRFCVELQRHSTFVIISPSLEACIKGHSSHRVPSSRDKPEDTGVSGWDVIQKVRVGGKIFLHVVVPKE